MARACTAAGGHRPQPGLDEPRLLRNCPRGPIGHGGHQVQRTEGGPQHAAVISASEVSDTHEDALTESRAGHRSGTLPPVLSWRVSGHSFIHSFIRSFVLSFVRSFVGGQDTFAGSGARQQRSGGGCAARDWMLALLSNDRATAALRRTHGATRPCGGQAACR